MKTPHTPSRWLALVAVLAFSATQITAQPAPGQPGRRNRGAGSGATPGSAAVPGAGTNSDPGAASGGATGDSSGGSGGSGGGLSGLMNSASGALGGLTGAGSSGSSGAASSTSTQSNSIESGTLLTVINKAFNTDSDIINPENNTITYKGQTMDPTQTREFRSRFERYLALAPAPDMLAYQDVLNQVSALLSTNNTGNVEDRMKQAWTLLYQAGEFKADGGASLDVANQVFNTWRLRNDNIAQQVAYSELERAKTLRQRDLAYATNAEAAESTSQASSGLTNAANALASSGLANPAALASANSSVLSGGTQSGTTSSTQQPAAPANNQQPAAQGQRGGANNSGTPPSSSSRGTVGPGTLASEAEGLGEIVGKIAQLQTSTLLTAQQAKVQLQLEIVELFLSRRYQHALIAASFYRFLFRGDAQSLDPKFKKDLGTMFGANNPTSSALGDMPFTIDSIELLSRQFMTDVQDGMEAVRANFSRHQNIAALERLEETFFFGEYLPTVTQFEEDKRQKLYDLYKKCGEARKLADLKDYEAVTRLSSDISELTTDFQASEVTAAVRAQEQMSSLAYSGAQQAQAAGNFDLAGKYTEQAVALWPLNPAINDGLKGYNVLSSASGKAVMVFDDAYAHQDWRRIYDHKDELIVGLMNDSQRLPQFKEVINKMSRIEMCLAQADEMVAQNNSFAAWEALSAAALISPGDVQVNQKKAELAPRVAEYVGKADQAKRAEDSGDTAASLAYYLAVQDMYPASQLARVGIDRVSTKLLASLAAEATTSGGSASDKDAGANK